MSTFTETAKEYHDFMEQDLIMLGGNPHFERVKQNLDRMRWAFFKQATETGLTQDDRMLFLGGSRIIDDILNSLNTNTKPGDDSP